MEVSRIRWRALQSAAEPQIRKLAAYQVRAAAAVAESARAETHKAWEWSEGQVTKDWTTVKIDLTNICREATVYQIDFHADAGAPLEVRSLQYVFDGRTVPEYVRAGDPAGRYLVTVPGLGKPLGITVEVRIAGDAKGAKGRLLIRKNSGS